MEREKTGNKNIKTEWDLTHFYKNTKDPQIEKDIVKIEGLLADFEKKYKNIDFSKDKNILLEALKDFEKLEIEVSSNKPIEYFTLQTYTDSQNNYIQAQSKKYTDRITKAKNKIIFFEISIGNMAKQIGESGQKEILEDLKFNNFAYFLKTIFDSSKYQLSEKEEKLNSLLSSTSYTMWVNGQKKLLNKQTVFYRKKEIPISEAVSILSELSRKDRLVLYKKIIDAQKNISHFAEAEINAIYNYKKILDEIRGYKESYSETVLENENNEESIENLISLVTKNFHISQRFYKLHAKLLKEKKLSVADTNVKIGKINRKFSFLDSLKIVGDAFSTFDQKYKDMLFSFVKNGQIDVYPKKGKAGGAFCWPLNPFPPYLLLNHTNDLRSVETLAHEMGHGIHTVLSQSQGVLYEDYSTSAAEVASTFFEQLTMNEIEKTFTTKEKIVFLHNSILTNIATIFRQVACFNFEKELHREIREKGMISAQDMAKIMSKHLCSYIGSSMDIKDDDGYTFVKWSHIRSFFYVYTYAYGQIISKSMLAIWNKDKSFKEKIEQFLKAGGSASPEDIFKSIGIDTTKPGFFLEGLKSIEKDIDKLEKLTRKV